VHLDPVFNERLHVFEVRQYLLEDERANVEIASDPNDALLKYLTIVHVVLDVRLYSRIVEPWDLHRRLFSEFFLGYIDGRISIQMSNGLLNPIIPGIFNQPQL
jgi:hypothetical protein